ncbi:MAG TPA: hypothetical protein VI306_06955 [Pyrinomonadaceae bacterium]
MDPFSYRLEAADHLNLILNRIGFALWQIQELESVAANYFVLLIQAQKGMGLEAGNLLIEKAKKKTFGATVRRLAEAGLLTSQLERRLNDLLAERNWLVHGSREASRSAPYNDAAVTRLLDRIDGIAEQSLALLREIGELVEAFAKKHGTTEEYIAETSKHLLDEWRYGDEA